MFSEYLRPWKLATLGAGIALLLVGARYAPMPDWDPGISFVMAGLAYAFAPWTLGVFAERRWRLAPLALLASWVTIDGSYWLYWHYVNPVVLVMRARQWPLSLLLYASCGGLWYFQGTFRELLVTVVPRKSR